MFNEEEVNEEKDDEDLKQTYNSSSRKRKINSEDSLRKHNIQSLKKKKKSKINLRAKINIIVESDAKIISKRRKLSKEDVTKATTVQIDDLKSVDAKLYINSIHHVTDFEPPISDRVKNTFNKSQSNGFRLSEFSYSLLLLFSRTSLFYSLFRFKKTLFSRDLEKNHFPQLI